MQTYLDRILTYLGVLFLLVGVFLAYLILYGDRLFYTQTYFYVSRLLLPTVDIETLFWTAIMWLSMWFFAFSANTKLKLIRIFRVQPSTKKLVGVLGATIGVVAAILLVARQILSEYQFMSFLSSAEFFLIAFFLGVTGGTALFLAVYPPWLESRIAQMGWMARIGFFFTGLILLLVLLASIELKLTNREIQEPIQVTEHRVMPPTHSISVVLHDQPKRIKPGNTIPFKAYLRVTRYDPNETARRYPIRLDSTHKYSATLNLRSIGFDILQFSGESSQPVQINELLEWNWLMSPKSGREGTNQSLIIDVSLHDLTDSNLVSGGPATTITVSIGTPLGLPTWLLSTEVTASSIIVGMLSLLLPWNREKSQRKETSIILNKDANAT